jgi:hypothetical protein
MSSSSSSSYLSSSNKATTPNFNFPNLVPLYDLNDFNKLRPFCPSDQFTKKFFLNGFSAEEAIEWIKEGFNPYDADLWSCCSFTAVDAAVWSKHYGDPADAEKWYLEKVDVDTAIKLEEDGFTSSDYKIIMSGDSEQYSRLAISSKFLNINDAKKWITTKTKIPLKSYQIWKNESSISVDDYFAYFKHNIKSEHAKIFIHFGVGADNAILWYVCPEFLYMLKYSPDEIADWIKAFGSDVKNACKWVKICDHAKTAKFYSDLNLDVDLAKEFWSRKFSLNQGIKFAFGKIYKISHKYFNTEYENSENIDMGGGNKSLMCQTNTVKFTKEILKKWITYFSNPKTAAYWLHNLMDPDVAKEWAAVTTNAERAYDYNKWGHTPLSVIGYIDYCTVHQYECIKEREHQRISVQDYLDQSDSEKEDDDEIRKRSESTF